MNRFGQLATVNLRFREEHGIDWQAFADRFGVPRLYRPLTRYQRRRLESPPQPLQSGDAVGQAWCVGWQRGPYSIAALVRDVGALGEGESSSGEPESEESMNAKPANNPAIDEDTRRRVRQVLQVITVPPDERVNRRKRAARIRRHGR